MQGDGQGALTSHLAARVEIGRVGGIALAGESEINCRFSERHVGFGHAHEVHGSLAGDSHGQGRGIREPDVLGSRENEPAADEAGVLAVFEEAGQVVEGRVRIASAYGLDEG